MSQTNNSSSQDAAMSEQLPVAKLKRNADISIVWILPIIALGLALTLVYDYYTQKGVNINVIFPDASGIIEHKTFVKFRGMQVGTVRKLTLMEGAQAVSAVVEMDKDTAQYLTDEASFWLVKPKVTMNGISGLDTIVTGAYIKFESHKAGDATQYNKDYVALQSQPSPLIPENASTFTLKANAAEGINPGSLIYHRKLEVGKVHDVQLSDDQQSIDITVIIAPKYQGLIKESSRFWSVSGIRANASLSGISIETEGLAAMLVGGIAFSSPENSDIAEEGQVFRLYKSATDARDALHLSLKLPADAEISPNTKVYLNAQEVGDVEELVWSDNFKSLTANVSISKQMTPLIRENTIFWLDSPSLSLTNLQPAKLLKGTVIRFLPGSGVESTQFTVQSKPPKERWESTHQQLSLSSNKGYGITQSSQIYFRNHPIGHIDWVRFNADTQKFEFDISIDKQYQKLITPETRFYNLTAVNFSANLQGINAEVPSLKQAFNGGIGIYLPAEPNNAPLTTHHFTLFANYASAVTNSQEPATTFTLISKHFLAPKTNSPVYYQQFEIGQVSAVALNDEGTASVTEVVIEPKYQHLVRTNTQFWQVGGVKVNASLSGVQIDTPPLLSMLAGGVAISTPDNSAEMATSTHAFALYRSKDAAQDAKEETTSVTVEIQKESQLQKGSPVKYRGYKVGEIVALKLRPDLEGLQAEVQLSAQYAKHFAVVGARYWLVQAEIGLSGVKHPEALLTGGYLAVSRGNGAAKHHFVAKHVNTEPENYRGNLAVKVLTPALGSLNIGSPVLFRQLRAGEVAGYRLSNDGSAVEITLHIFPEFKHLVKQASKFWNASGLEIEAGLFSGVEIKSQTVETLLAGGVAFTTAEGPAAKNNQTYTLHQQPDSDWLNWTTEDDD